MKISFLLHNAYGIGGTIRSTFNVAGALAARHTVEIVSLIRTIDTPNLPLHPAVRLRPLIDLRPHEGTADATRTRGGDLGHPLLTRPSAHVPAAEARGTTNFNALTDERVADHLRHTDADVVIATRPGLVVYLAALGRADRYLRIGQEHRLHGTHRAEIRAACDAAIPHLDAYTSVSEADAATHRAHLPGVTTRLTALPNAVPATGIEPSDGRAKLVVAAGRLIPVKRYDLLVAAWATVAAKHPDWHLRIYGRGPQLPALRRQIDQLGLADAITLMGAYSPIETEWAKGSIAAVTSREESFGMTIVEAMHCGVPVVATDCPHGPGEIITDGRDGLLVPVGDADGIAKGLLTLIEDEELRRSMGEAARVAARRYAPERVAAAYERLIEELRTARGTAAPAHRRRVVPPMRGRAPGTPLTSTLKGAVKQLVRKPLRPVASCRVTAGGDLSVLVEPAEVQGGELELTVTRRKSDEAPFRVPLLPPAGADPSAPWTATLDRTALDLAEGRWDLHVVRPADGARRRVVCRYAEGRGLLGLEPLPGSPFTWWIPYRTVDGYLALRTWRRPAHADARVIRPDAEGIVVEGTLHGARFGPGAAPVAVATPSRGPAGTFLTGVTALDGGRFRFTVPYQRIQEARTDETGTAGWTLTLHKSAATDSPIRIGRVVGDIVDRDKTDLFPVTHGVRPHLTRTGDLIITSSTTGN
ncbi:glycosyl transferase family 1 [Streptomyces hygroscopicus subsp. sporocinereus]|uniref:D-inositol 3-phosphate glycosyltransferase n=1 Tax=Streptomyces hygroscopicus TaxID=1912 RepID=A0ABQ3U589_STRHY|nr:glycosyltransferase family 4 protein [Streptomyces hygroscopicus]GHJ30597.1 glycosyl transferase family 1 [Streptomyces hygroscopicus]